MKTHAEIAAHPKARLHREIVRRLRACGSIEGAEQAWAAFRLNRRLWKRIVTYGLDRIEQRHRLNKIAFPDCNWLEVDSALAAGNKLKTIHDLACGTASVVKDLAGRYQVGAHGLKTTAQGPRMQANVVFHRRKTGRQMASNPAK